MQKLWVDNVRRRDQQDNLVEQWQYGQTQASNQAIAHTGLKYESAGLTTFTDPLDPANTKLLSRNKL